MWLFLPYGFYSVRAYDPDKGGIPVDEDHVVVRARIEADIQKVRDATDGWFDLPNGSDYRYHLAVPAREWARFLSEVALSQKWRPEMKSWDNPRHDIYMEVWEAARNLRELDGAAG